MRGNFLNILYSFIAGMFLILFILCSCEHDVFEQGQQGEFSFSADTVMFDTIFTQLGTPTYKLLVRNENNYNLEFDSIYLAHGSRGFIVNINGQTQLPANNITVGANDSLYIFIQAFVPANDDESAFVNEDSLVFVSGKTIKDVNLVAFGQNVIHFRNDTIQTQEWFNTKPILIYGTLTLDNLSQLTIHEGVKVYFHRNARLVINGNLAVNGSLEKPVKFMGDRLESDYDSIPGQWGGIIMNGSSETHSINYALIRNATTGIQIGNYTNNEVVKAEIKNTIISNMSYAALLAYQADVSAQNSVFANSGNTSCILNGGDYSFLHCTLANYGARFVARSVDSKTLVLQNYIKQVLSETTTDFVFINLNKAYFGNTIIYGNSSNELGLIEDKNFTFNYTFENCLLRSSENASNQNIQTSVLNKSPMFIRPELENFRLDTLSPAKDAGKIEIGASLPLDIMNNSRMNDSAPDMGAYERKESR